MKKAVIVSFISKLNGMIAAIEQAGLMDSWTQREKRACELLKDARLLLVDDLDEQDERNERARKHQHEENLRILRLTSEGDEE